VDGAIGAYDETGCLAFDLSTAPETLIPAVEAALEELVRITATPVPGDELERVRNSYIFDLEFSRDSAYELGGRYGWGELMQVVRSIEEDQCEARRVTAAELQETALALFAPENLRLVAVGPWKRGMKKALRELVAEYQQRCNEGDKFITQ
jgi:predicted Zn-dependent peptidase